jgi:KDO2-lipid IV(A) lauroyltransferase
MRFSDLADSKLARRVGLGFCRHAPRWMGYLVARLMKGALIRYMPELHLTMAQNLRQVLGPSVSDAEVRAMARWGIGHYTRCAFDFFSTATKSRDEILKAIQVPNAGLARARQELAEGRSVLAVCPHISNFDLAGIALGATGLPLHVLSLADPNALIREQNRIREHGGLTMNPISPRSLRDAIRRLKSGGVVLSGLDRPVPRDGDLVEFFGKPSYLPLGPARMALISDATVFVGSCRYEQRDGYHLDIVGPVEIVRTGSRRQDIRTNARNLAVILEGLVRAHPEQWLMFHPVWPSGADSREQ